MNFITNEKDLINYHTQALYFYAPWMVYHKKMLIMIDKMENKYKDIKFFAIDVDTFKVLCKRYNVNSIPTVLLIKNGNEVKRVDGMVMTSAFKAIFADICKE